MCYVRGVAMCTHKHDNLYLKNAVWGRGGTKSLIFHETFAHTYQSVSSWVCPHTVAMLKAKNSGIVKGSLAQPL